MLSVLAGLLMGLSLIVAIGAQNVFVLRSGLARDHTLLVVLVCIASDVMLIAAGVAGLGALITSVPWFISIARWAGATFLVAYGVMAIRRAFAAHPASLNETVGSDGGRTLPRSAGAVVAATAAMTWLNPHVYLDTVVLLGSVAATHGNTRWLFGAGAMLGSTLWFSALGFGARYLGRLLRRPSAWRILDALIGVVMFVSALSLLWGAWR